MADLESKEFDMGNSNVHEMVNDRTSDERKVESEAIDTGDMYRMGKDQQFRVSAERDHGRKGCVFMNPCSVFSGCQQ
jgi:hypothetical protein